MTAKHRRLVVLFSPPRNEVLVLGWNTPSIVKCLTVFAGFSQVFQTITIAVLSADLPIHRDKIK